MLGIFCFGLWVDNNFMRLEDCEDSQSLVGHFCEIIEGYDYMQIGNVS